MQIKELTASLANVMQAYLYGLYAAITLAMIIPLNCHEKTHVDSVLEVIKRTTVVVDLEARRVTDSVDCFT